jgi:predicted Zn-dependent protease
VEELEYARQVLAPHDVRLEIADVLLLETVPRADDQWRDEVLETFTYYDGTLHIFFVEECFDSDVGADGNPKDLRGIAWNKKGQSHMHFAAVAADAPITTFSHELGHVLDLDHIKATDPTNIMCQCTREEGASFTNEQGSKMRIP